jgi:glutaredoxin-like protein NrdH
MQYQKVSGKNSQHKVTLYALSTCVWCKLTKQFLNESGVAYEFADVDLLNDEDKDKAHAAITSKGGMLTYPTTIIDDKILVTGYRKEQLKEVLGV